MTGVDRFDEFHRGGRRTIRRRAVAAPVVVLVVVLALVLVVVASLWLLVDPGRGRGSAGDPVVGDGAAPSPPATEMAPGSFGPEDLVQPDDVGAGYTLENEEAFAPRASPTWTFSLEHCAAYAGLKITAFRSYTWMRINIVSRKGDDTGATDVHTALNRYPVPVAEQVMADVRRVVRACDDFSYAGGEASTDERPGRVRHTYTIEDRDFAGDESLLIRHVTESRDARSGELVPGDQSVLVGILAVVRVGDRVEVLQTDQDDTNRMREIATKAARRL